jgi:NAD(P)-dependent dehydrogenase (short-subunit alcohol dehydrogenase family)
MSAPASSPVPPPASVPVAVIGAGPGIGAATARRFAREGHPVAVLGRGVERLQELAREIEAAGGRAVAIHCDVVDRDSTRAAIAEVRATLGDPGVLVHNPLVHHRGSPSSVDLAELDAQLAANVGGALACVQEVLPAMRAAGRGTILHTGGGLALNPLHEYAGIGIAKAAQRSLFLSLAQELEPEGIHVATVTVAAFVRVAGEHPPEEVADLHWALYAQPREAWEREVTYGPGLSGPRPPKP